MGSVKKVIGSITGTSDVNQGAGAAKDQLNAAQAQSREDLSPFVSFGKTFGLDALAKLQGPNGQQELENTPGYKFTRDQGIQAVTRNAAAAGFNGSGNVLHDITQFASGLASKTYADEFSRRYNIASLGSNAAAQQANNSMTFGSDQASVSYGAGRDTGAMKSNLLTQGTNSAMSAAFIFCWVAEELYGVDSVKTYEIRKFVGRHLDDDSDLGRFLQRYQVHGKQWAQDIREDLDTRHAFTIVFDGLYESAIKELN
jgi:hypothetical protein